MAAIRQIGALAAMTFALAACGASVAPSAAGITPGPATAPATRAVSVPGFLSFDLPPSWLVASFDAQSVAHSTVLAYFSTEPLSQPCDRIPATSGCPAYPVERLGADGVLVSWTAYGLGGQSIDWTKGDAVTVAGQAGRLTTPPPDAACSAIGGTQAIVVDLRGSQAPSFTEMAACYNGPDLARTEAQLRAMLASARGG